MTSGYNGYLTPYVGKIIAGWKAGLSAGKIAAKLPRIPSPWGYYNKTDAAMIRYVLIRLGYLEDNRPQRTPIVPPRRYVVLWERIFDPPAAPVNRGRPLDMGGPRDVWIERDPWSNQ